MRAGRGAWGATEYAACLVCALLSAALAPGAELPAEIRVLSGPGPATTVAVRAHPDVDIQDRTPGARPAAPARGPASTGETFAGEITLFLSGFAVSRPAAIDVADPLVSVVRLFPEAGGTTVTVFVRQPVSYSVARPSPSGEVRVELRGRRPAAAARRPGPPVGPRLEAPVPDEKEVAVDAETLSYDQQTNTLTARGGVTLKRGETTLTADEVVYDRTNSIAEARGNVVLTDPQATVEGDFAHLNLEDETGWVESADATLRPTNYLLRAGRLEKLGGPRYSVADGIFTTCECGGLERPSWSIKGAKTEVKLQGAGVARGVSFRVKDVPVLYLPYLVFPVATERQTGFLMPRFGVSNRRGFEYEQPFFWAINKSADLTVATDIETEARLGLLGEIRYVLSRQGRGNFTAAFYNERIRGTAEGTVETEARPADIPENRFGFSGHHLQRLPGRSKFYLDLFAVSDDSFLREINAFAFAGRNDLALRSTRFTTSRTGVYKAWERGLARIDTTYHQDLVDPQSLAPQRLPRLDAEHAIPLLGDRLVGRLAGEGIYFERERGFEGFRGDVAPELFLPMHLGRLVHGSVTGRVRETAYYLTDTRQVARVVPDPDVPVAPFFRVAPEMRRLDRERTRELAEIHGRVGTEVGRVFGFRHLGLEKLKHTLEPEAQYLFVPRTDRALGRMRTNCSDLPLVRNGGNCTLFSEGYLFDERDAINRRNFFSYGLTTRLLGRAATSPAAAPEEADAEGEAAPAASPPIDPDALAQGLSADAVPDVYGPPAPSGDGPGPAVPPRELARASILHGFDLSRELVGGSHQSDLDMGLRLTPLDWLGMTYNTTVSAEERRVRGLSAGLFVREPWWTPPSAVRSFQSATTVALSYRFIEKSVNRELEPGSAESLLLATQGVNEVDGSLYLRLGNYLGFIFRARYDLSTTTVFEGKELGPHFLERDYFFRLISRCNCWVLEAGLADKFNPDERSFRVQFTLVGLGSFGRSPLAQNYVGFAPLSGLGQRPGRSGPGR